MKLKSSSFDYIKLSLIFFALLGKSLLACTYCASTSPVCVDYDDVCASYSLQCTGYSTRCDSYEDVCNSYDTVCDAYDDNGYCVSYSYECTSYSSQCASYSQYCDGYQSVCDYYETRCVQYQDQCNSYYYGDYFTVTGTVRSYETGNFAKSVDVTLTSTNWGDSITNKTNSSGRYSNTLFVYDDSAGYLNVQVCASSSSASATVCRNVSQYDTCNSPSYTRDMDLSLDRITAPYNLTVAATSHTQLTPSWSISYSSAVTGYYVAWGTNFIAPDCRTGVDVGYTSSYTINGLSPLTTYAISVCAHDANGNVSLEDLGSQTTKRAPPPAPTSFSLNSNSTTEMTASWTSGGGSTAGFYIAIAAGAYAPNCASGTDMGTNLGAVYNSLSPGTLYTLALCAYDVYGNLSTQISSSHYTKFLPPPPPTGLSVSSDSASKLTASWASGGGSTSAYYINYALGSVAPSCSGSGATYVTATSKSFTGLNPLTQYSFSVCALNPDGVMSDQISASQTTKRLPPPAPTSLNIVAVSPYQLDLSWVSGAGATTGFLVAYALGSTAPNCNLGVDVGNVTSYSLTGLQGLTNYTVAICSYDSFNDSDNSAPLTGSKQTLRAPPPVPTNFNVVAASTSQLNVSWVSGGGSTAGFYFKYALGTVAPDCKTGTFIGNINSKSITGLTANTAYTVSLCAKDNFGLYSTQVSATQTTKRNPPPHPTNFSAVATSDTTITATWKSGGGSSAGFYLRTEQGINSSGCAAGEDVGLVTSSVISSLLPNTKYTLTLCAYDGYGNNSAVQVARLTTLRTPPPSPTNLSIVANSTSQLTLNWLSGGGDVRYYYVKRAQGSVPPGCSGGTYVGNVNTYKATGLTANTKYSFSICAVDGFATRSLPLEGSGTTKRNPPPAPKGLTLTAKSDTEIGVKWQSGGGLTTGYLINYALGATAPNCLAGLDVHGNTSYTITGLVPNTKYTVTVCAYDDINLFSSQVNAAKTTLRTPPPGPTGLAVSPLSNSSIQLSWTSGGGATTGFKVARGSAGTAISLCTTGAITNVNLATSFVSKGLAANTHYYFAVCSYDSFGTLSAALLGDATTLRNPPPKPTTISFTSVHSTDMTINWKSGGGSTAGYYVNIAAGSVAPSCVGGSDVGLTNSYVASGLTPNTNYTAAICSYDGFGNNSAALTGSKKTNP